MRLPRLPLSALALVAANLVPLIGVVFLGWSLAQILLLFWSESAIIGFFTVLKMLTMPGLLRFFLAPFFCFHFGIFMVVHLVFIVVLFAAPELSAGAAPVLRAVGLGAAVLFASHAFSFIHNFILGGERNATDLNKLMVAPYPRIVIMQVALIGGAFLMGALGTPKGALALLVVLKTGIDLKTHLREREKVRRAVPSDAAP